MHCQKPDLFATLKCDELSNSTIIVFVPQDQVSEYKEKYGDKLDILFEDEVREEQIGGQKKK